MTEIANDRVWRWRQWAILAGAPVVAGLLAWQLWTLSPREWCQTAYDFSKATDVAGVLDALTTCVGLQAKILDIKDHAIIGLLVILGMGYIMLLARELGLRASITGPKGLGASIGQDAAQAAQQVAKAATEEADHIAEAEDEVRR